MSSQKGTLPFKIVCQNLGNGRAHNDHTEYIENLNLSNDNNVLYAFQEWKKGRSGIVKFAKPEENDPYKICDENHKSVQEIWQCTFPWIEFKNYYEEYKLDLGGEKILIINFHCSPTYEAYWRYTLLERLKQLQSVGKIIENIILLGDFNSAFGKEGQIQNPENCDNCENCNTCDETNKSKPLCQGCHFLKEIEALGFNECLLEGENKENPHYTFYDKEDGRKYDHVFVKNCKDFVFEIEYIDEFYKEKPDSEINPKLDHYGILITISKKGRRIN